MLGSLSKSRWTSSLALRTLLRRPHVSSWSPSSLVLMRSMGSYEQPPVNARTQEEASEWVKKQLEKGYRSYGKLPNDPLRDKALAHLSVFMVVSVVAFLAFLTWYKPDMRNRQWAMREAYLVLREREEKGLPLVDKNLIDPSKFELPSDEELVNDKVIV